MTTPTLPFDELIEDLLNMTTGFVWIFGFTVVALLILKVVLGGFDEQSRDLSGEDLLTEETSADESKNSQLENIPEKQDVKSGVRKVII